MAMTQLDSSAKYQKVVETVLKSFRMGMTGLDSCSKYQKDMESVSKYQKDIESVSKYQNDIESVSKYQKDIESVSKYQKDIESVLKSLSEGLAHLSKFVEDLKAAFNVQLDELNYIDCTLKPSIVKASFEFNEMVALSEELLKEINSDFEKSVSELEQKKIQIKGMDRELASISEELKGKEEEVKAMENDCGRKRRELSNAEECLSTARRKLQEAEESQTAAVAGGFGTAAGCAIVSFIFPPALVGVAAGAGVGTAGLTVFEDAKNECSKRVDCARSEVSSSEAKLQETKDLKHRVEKRLLEVRTKKLVTENEIDQEQNVVETMKQYQAQIIEINEKIKMCYRELSIFHGRFNVVYSETKGCYSLLCLQSPTKTVCSSLQTLLNSDALEACCERSQVLHLTSQVERLVRIEWPAITQTDDFDDLI